MTQTLEKEIQQRLIATIVEGVGLIATQTLEKEIQQRLIATIVEGVWLIATQTLSEKNKCELL